MANFVLVAGAWLGARAWDEVVAELCAAGHGAYPLTLSGLAEKSGAPAGQRAHVADVVAEVERLDLREVVLVGHSYSGIPVGQAAERIGDRLARLVLVDANVPVAGESFADQIPEPAALRADLAAHGGWWPPLPPAEFAGQGLTVGQITRITAGATPHPGPSLTEPAVLEGPLSALPAVYVKCLLDWPEPPPLVARLVADGHWRLVELDTGHWPMFSRPAELARVLAESARTEG
ncbi:alpha/beta fold hydrolase [Streptomyces sp. CBMA156]|uniref:alpha/beta fold hydrolase n=1 Tax=Streptomyces sp. CBMA156 TaxID=1930280 RepID=UPI001661A810|nr:alpha/beta hydrolase [Streptomyces sp. CBMA156]MBD0675110.1 esterase [Streptomyces sp. CBMA156]MBD0675865.1 esterase [Streptomyces sp. CBMA156]